MDALIRIKRAVLAGRYAFSEKARIGMETDQLTELDVAESILNAVAVYKRLRPRGEVKSGFKEFQLDLSKVDYQPISNELWQQELRTQKARILILGEGTIDELRLEDSVVSGLVDFDDVS